MILYDPNHKVSLTEFGINIPVHDSRTKLTFKHLCDHPVLGRNRHRWHIPRIDAAVSKNDLLRVHAGDYVDRLYSDQLELEIVKTFELIDADGHFHRYNPRQASLPLTGLFDRLLDRVAGTLQCGRVALDKGFCFFFGGGMHHAHKDHGSGFCLVNDILIAVRRLQADRHIQTAWIVDVDAHKGDGTAAITADDDTITTLSIHMAAGWPLDESPYDHNGLLKPAFIPSNIDIPVSTGEQGQYNRKLKAGLDILLQAPRPDMVYVVSGADPYVDDELPSTQSLRLTLKQLMDRDRLVYDFLLDLDLPMAYLMAGGYGREAWRVYSQFLEWSLTQRL